MNILGLDINWRRKSEAVSLDTVLRRIDALYEVSSGISITPENCEQSPTVKAVVTAVTRRFAVMPVHVFRKSVASNGLTSKELLPSHPVARLLGRPNEWQSRANYWADSASWLLRYGNHYCFKARGQTGPIRYLYPLHPSSTEPKQDDDLVVTYRARMNSGQMKEFDAREIHHARMTARDGLKGDSPVMDVREAIGLEIAAERFGATFFGNGALPGIVFKYTDGTSEFETDEERKSFLDEFQQSYGQKGRFRAILPPKGIEMGPPLPVDNEAAQFIELRNLQRTIIAGAFGVPPHLVGDLSKGTFNNVEQQGIEFKTNVILPLTSFFEAAMERDLLTDADRRDGVIIRFNPDAVLRGDFKSQQEGLAIQRQNGIINANEWREHIGRNPIPSDDGGDEYYRQGPSGQSANPSDPPNDPPPDDPSDDEGNPDDTNA